MKAVAPNCAKDECPREDGGGCGQPSLVCAGKGATETKWYQGGLNHCEEFSRQVTEIGQRWQTGCYTRRQHVF